MNALIHEQIAMTLGNSKKVSRVPRKAQITSQKILQIQGVVTAGNSEVNF